MGLADVLAIEACPDIQPGPGRLVTGTFKHTAGIVLDLKVESESKPIGVTPTHPFWSVDRQDWVAAGDLRIGERLETLDGTTVVESISPRSEPEMVYNIEVEGDHVYRVGESGVLVHNASNKCKPKAGSVTNSAIKKITFKDENDEDVTGEFGEDATAYLTPANVGGARTDFNRVHWFQKLRKVAGDPIEMGHIVASQIGGKGEKTWNNLTPLFDVANAPAMSTCENFLAQLVLECGYCVNVDIKVVGYGRNVNVPKKARPAFPTKIVFEWEEENGCESGKFEIKNTTSSTAPSKCSVNKLPCRK